MYVVLRRRRQRGFTLVELLVVIAIIGILAAILLPAVNIAIYQARKSRVSVEIAELQKAIEEYRNDRGDYPPDFSNATLVDRHLLKAFPRINRASLDESQTMDDAKAKIDPAEALVFWLAGTFNDPRRPLTGGGPFTSDPREIFTGGADLKIYFSFNEGRLVDRDGDGYFEYVSPHSDGAPYIYFDSRSYHLDSCMYEGPTGLNIQGVARPYFRDPNTTEVGNTNPNPPAANQPLEYANPNTYQIISAFVDGDYGRSTDARIYPLGKNYTKGDLDNLTNFSEGKTLEDAMPDA